MISGLEQFLTCLPFRLRLQETNIGYGYLQIDRCKILYKNLESFYNLSVFICMIGYMNCMRSNYLVFVSWLKKYNHFVFISNLYHSSASLVPDFLWFKAIFEGKWLLQQLLDQFLLIIKFSRFLIHNHFPLEMHHKESSIRRAASEME